VPMSPHPHCDAILLRVTARPISVWCAGVGVGTERPRSRQTPEGARG
jgi:hypothetical protein